MVSASLSHRLASPRTSLSSCVSLHVTPHTQTLTHVCVLIQLNHFCHLPSHCYAVSSLNVPVFNPLITGDEQVVTPPSIRLDTGAPLAGQGNASLYNPIALLPAKLSRRILDLKFVEMANMLPDSSLARRGPALDAQLIPRRAGRRALVQDISQWTECFSRMAAVLATRYPSKSPELWAYQASILRAARNFGELCMQ